MILSICIPTHHGRGKTLRGAVESILAQVTDDLKGKVEICVSDNSSADGTERTMRAIERKHPGVVRYHRHDTNMGFIKNLLHLMQTAKGDFCWLLGSDDQLAKGGLAKALRVLEQHPDTAGVAVNWTTYDKNMRKIEADLITPLLPDDHHRTHVYTTKEDILLNCSPIHTLISGNILARKIWASVVEEVGLQEIEKYVSYPHLYVIGMMAIKHPKWVWCPDKLVKYRADGAASAAYSAGEFHTFNLKIMRDISLVWSTLLGKRSPIYRRLMHKQALYAWQPHVIRWFKKQHNYRSIGSDVNMLYVFTKHLHFTPGFWYRTLPSLMIPHYFLKDDFFVSRCLRLPVRAYNSVKYRSGLLLKGRPDAGGNRRAPELGTKITTRRPRPETSTR